MIRLLQKQVLPSSNHFVTLGPKSQYSATPLVFNYPDGGVHMGRSPSNFICMSMGGQRTKWRRNIAENFNRLSRVHERYMRQTDGRRHGEHEREFTFAKNVATTAVWKLHSSETL